ncbi:MAG: Hsp70 family protein, partial [Myxococcota bacterium]
ASVGVHIPQATNIDGQTYDLSAQLVREEMNALVKPLVDRAMTVLAQVMADAGMKPSDVDDVILVGGATRMLCVRDRLQEYFGKAPHKGVHPDEAVAVGAALLARAVETREGVRLIDVNPMSLGVALPAGRFKKVIERNTALPASKSYVIATTKNKQPSLELEVYQGEADLVAQNERLATLGFTDLPKKAKGEVRVQVNFHLSEECILTLTAVELTTGREVTTSIATKGTPSVVLRKMHTRAGAQGAAVASVGGGGFLGWLKGLFGR